VPASTVNVEGKADSIDRFPAEATAQHDFGRAMEWYRDLPHVGFKPLGPRPLSPQSGERAPSSQRGWRAAEFFRHPIEEVGMPQRLRTELTVFGTARRPIVDPCRNAAGRGQR